ncbi:MAG: hypothetical protein ACOX6T_04915 [Myxococcales bacterium]|jgi:hypothetical protein
MPALTFADHEAFQKSVLWSTGGAAAAGLIGFVLSQAGLTVPGVAIVCAVAALAACGKTIKSRIGFGVLGALAGLLSLAFPTHPAFGLAAAGTGMGLVFALARSKEAGSAPGVGQRIGKSAFLAAALLTAIGLTCGTVVVGAFDSRGLLEALMPSPLAAMVRTGLIGFFLSLGGAGAHLVREPDAVENLYARLLPELAGDLKVLCARAMTNYRRCAEILSTGEPGFARAQLTSALNEATTRILELARRWQAIDRELGERAEGEIAQRLSELRSLKESTRDEVARKQLGIAEAALNGELQQIDRIRRGRERIVARLHSEMALLERTRFALLGLKSSDAHLRAAELSALSESLSSIAREMDCEAQAIDEIISQVVDIKGEQPGSEAVAPIAQVAVDQKP